MTAPAGQSISDLTEAVRTALALEDPAARELLQGACGLIQISHLAEADERSALSTAAGTLARMLEIAQCFPEDAGILDPSQRESLIALVATALGPLERAASGDEDSLAELEATCAEARDDWGDYLELLPGEHSDTAETDAWAEEWSLDEENPAHDLDDGDHSAATGDPQQVDLILAALAGNSAAKPDSPTQCPPAVPAATPKPDDSPHNALDSDPELRDAFLDDATRGLAAIEQIVLDLEQSPGDATATQQLCRELHTLKGASASVGLSDLAALLHSIEDLIQTCQADASPLPIPRLLQDVDTIRNQIAAVGGNVDGSSPMATTPAPSAPTAESPTPPASQPPVATSPIATPDDGSHDSLRVSTTRLDRLMDLLGELVILRNRRQSEVDQLRALQDDLHGCVSRLRQTAEHGRRQEAGADLLSGETRDSGLLSALEIADDVAAVSRRLQQNLQPISDENAAISRVIRRFRHELTELRRVPISGLFFRLQRAARDVARQEGKQLQVTFCGDQTGLERSLQERLFEPLVHLVRNAVSHGIEDPQTRAGHGKPEGGRITLEAVGSLNSLTILIRDDGRGIDREAVRRRGIELGLWDAARSADDDELLRLIFRPGFSTRRETTEVSGRGVGMDVVANALENLRGRIDLETEPGRGTTIRLTIALRSVIEHLMVFRVGGQQFGIPMQYVGAASRGQLPPELDPRHQPGADVAPVSMGALLGLPSDGQQTDSGVLVMSSQTMRSATVGQQGTGGAAGPSDHHPSAIHHSGNTAIARQAFTVDEVIGPEEAVVRPLPSALASHPLLAGATLSGSGQVVLLLDGEAILSRASLHRSRIMLSEASDQGSKADSGDNGAEPCEPSPRSMSDQRATGTGASVRKALVVDDSLSARVHTQRMLEERGFTVVLAEDGMDALAQARGDRFDLVLSDFEMPRLNGLQLLDELRTHAGSADWPVAIVSSRSEAEFQSRARQSGATAWYTKPLRESQLVELLAAIGHPECLDGAPANSEVKDSQ